MVRCSLAEIYGNTTYFWIGSCKHQHQEQLLYFSILFVKLYIMLLHYYSLWQGAMNTLLSVSKLNDIGLGTNNLGEYSLNNISTKEVASLSLN